MPLKSGFSDGLGGVNSVKAYTAKTKTPILLTGGKFAECFTSGTYIIQMQGWQQFIAYENAEGIAFDEDSYMQFDLEETVNDGQVRVDFTFDDNSVKTEWWCLGIGDSKDDTSTPYNHYFDESKYWLKKGFATYWADVKDKKITKVTIRNWGTENVITFKVNGGTFCGESMTIKDNNTSAFGAYGGVFSATTAQTNIFKLLNVEVGDYQKVVFKFGEAVPETGNWAYNYQSGVYPPSITVGATELEIQLNGANLPELTIFNWNANPDPINITEVYFYKEEEEYAALDFNEYGAATVDKKYLEVTGGLSYNTETGVLTTNGEEGSMVLNFSDPVDLRNLKTFSVNRSGNDNILDKVEFYDADGTIINTWNSSKLSNDGLDNNATKAFINNNPVKKMVWPSAAGKSTDLTLTITGIAWQLKTMSCVSAGETVLNTLPWIKISDSSTPTPDWNMHTQTDTYYGDYSGNATHYVDLTSYSELRVYRDNNDPCRAFFINSAGTSTNQVNTSSATWNADKKYWSFDLSGIEKWNGKVALKCIKANAGVSNLTVNNIVVYKTPAANAPKYVLAGSGMKLAETVAALADENVTCIDATGVTALTTDPNYSAGKTELISANPNCLFLATANQLSNNNVIVDGNCANLELTDGYPFKAPVNFTAGSASYTTTINADAQAGTLCLPFEATIPAEGVTAYTLAYANGDKATATLVETTIPANTPVLLNGSGSQTFTGSSVAITAGAAKTSEAMTGVYESTTAPLNSFVLQKQDDNVGFFKVASNDITVSPFRAYMTAQTQGARLKIVYPGETTGISDATRLKEKGQMKNDIFDLQGRRVKTFKKGLYIVNGKKVIK